EGRRAKAEADLLTSAFFLLTFVRLVHRLRLDPVRPVGPARQILQLAPFAAERAPGLFHGMTAAEHAQRRLRHEPYFILARQIGRLRAEMRSKTPRDVTERRQTTRYADRP